MADRAAAGAATGVLAGPDERTRPWRGWWHPPRQVRAAGREPGYRITLASERTFLAWIRASLALLAGGWPSYSRTTSAGSLSARRP